MTSLQLQGPDSHIRQIAKNVLKSKGGAGLKFEGNSIRTPKIKFYGPKIRPARLQGNGMIIRLQNIPNQAQTFKLK